MVRHCFNVVSIYQIHQFQKKIFAWWNTHKRILPWRETRNPYFILVSEMMLQQTQVERVIPKYNEFIQVYPTIGALAQASVGDVIRIWKGLGYNRRAIYLKKTADIIVTKHKGNFPQMESEIIQFPGVGTYTARAILVFAFNKNVAAVDTNICKIITHFFYKDTPQTKKNIQDMAERLVPQGKSWEWHQALMDYGALELLNHSVKNTGIIKKSIPFAKTKRFIRGRIIEILRNIDISEQELVLISHTKYQRSENYIRNVILELEMEKMIVRNSFDILSLPK